MFVKKLSILLVAIVLFTSFGTFSVFARTDDALKIHVVNDLHYYTKSGIGTIQKSSIADDYPLYGHMTRNCQLYAESEAIILSMLDSLSETDAQYVIMPGDLVSFGNAQAHQMIAGFFREFEKETGKQIYVINGNHDLMMDYSKEHFASNYADFGYSEAYSRHSESLSYTANLGDKYRLLALDTLNEYGFNDNISVSLLAWISEQAVAAKEDGRNLIAMTHYGILNHLDGTLMTVINNFMDAKVRNADAVCNFLADSGIKYIFTGHIHCNDIKMMRSDLGNELYDIETNSLVGYPCSYRTVTFSDESVTVETSYITEIDTANLPLGYSAEQLELIENDFPGYAYGAMAPSVEYVVSSKLADPSNLIGMLGVKQDSKMAGVLKRIINAGYYAACLPLYDDGAEGSESIEKIASRYGYEIPESEYKTLFDIAAYAIGQIAGGDENIPVSSTEFNIAWNACEAVILYALDSYESELNDVTKLLSDKLNIPTVGEKISKTVYKKNFATELLTKLYAPLIEEISVDDFNPADVNVTLPSYSAEPQISENQEKVNGLFEAIQNFVLNIIDRILSKLFA